MRRVAEVTTPAAWWWARSQGVVRRLVVAPAASGQPPALTPQACVAVAATIDDVLRLARRTAPALSSRSVRVELTASLDDACWSLVQQYVLHDPPRWDGLDGTLHASRAAVRAMRAIEAPRVPVLDLGTARLVHRLGARGGRAVGEKCRTGTSEWWSTSAASVWRWDNTDHVSLRAELIRQTRDRARGRERTEGTQR